MAEGKELQEAEVRGPRGSILTVSVGDKICFINPEVEEDIRVAQSTRFMINQRGPGPFELLGIKYYPRDGHPLTMFCFVDDHQKEVEVSSDYFTKYE